MALIGSSFLQVIESHIPTAKHVHLDDETLSVELTDGRTILVPLAWYPRLSHGTEEEQNQWKLIGNGRGIHWPMLDEDVSVENLLVGRPSGESQKSLKKWLDGRHKKQPEELT